MAKVGIQKKGQELAWRARKMARMIPRRAYVSSDGVFLVQGAPEFKDFLKCLESYTSVPSPDRQPTPSALGFAPDQVLRMTKTMLAELGRALQKWRKIIRDKDAHSVRTKAEAQRLEGWKAETESYGKRLERLHELLRDTAQGSSQVKSTYVLLEADPEEMQSVLREVSAGRYIPDHWQWMAEIVYWMGGSVAMRRFLAAPQTVTEAEQAQIEAVERFRDALLKVQTAFSNTIQDNIVPGGIQTLDTHPAKAHLEGLFAREKEVVSLLGIRPPGRPRDLPDYLAATLSHCEIWLNTVSQKSSTHLVAGLAALCAFDQSEVHLPQYLVHNDAKPDKFSSYIQNLAEIASEPGYDNLLALFNKLNPFLNKMDFIYPKWLKALVMAGGTAQDLLWLSQHSNRSRSNIFERYAEAGLNPGPLRQLIDHLDNLGVVCSDEEVKHALEQFLLSKEINLIKAFDSWLSQLAAMRMDRTSGRRVWQTLLDVLNLGACGLQYRSFLRKWFEPQPDRNVFPGILEAEVGKSVRQQFDLLAWYQKLAGEKVRLTGTLQKLVGEKNRISDELTYLEQQEASGSITDNARKRLKTLRMRAATTVSREKLFRKAGEVCAITAIEGLRKAVLTETADLWRRFAGSRTLKYPPSESQQLEILRWANSLDSTAKLRLWELLDAWKAFGIRYKEQISLNHKWLERLHSESGIDIEKWLYPPSQQMNIAGIPVRISVATDPFRVLLMGSYFDTCLDLEGGSNRDSVLSHAYEASKQVLYVTDADGHILARKLVGLSLGGRMVGFRTYMSMEDEVIRTELRRKVHTYCGVWASNCGAILADYGQPDVISDLIWYDDGLEDWLPEGLDQLSKAVELSGVRKPFEELLARYWDTCADILRELELWPVSGGETPEAMLRNRRGLAEELLAETALDLGDNELLRELERNCTTPGGRLQNLKVMTILDPERADQTFMLRMREHDSKMWRPRILALMADCTSESTFDNLLKELFRNYVDGSLYLYYALDGQPHRARKLRRFLMHGRWQGGCSVETLAILHAAQAAEGRPHPDNLVCKLMGYKNSGPFGITNDRFTSTLAQWMPPLRNPKRSMKYELLKSIWYDAELEQISPYTMEDVRVGLVVWCLRNPSPAATAFLRKHSEKHPSALLGLALAEPLRYHVQIEKAVERLEPSLPVAIGVLLAKGLEDGSRYLASRKGYAEKPILIQDAASFLMAVEKLDWQQCSELPGYDTGKPLEQLRQCLPLVMRGIWKSLDEPRGTCGVELFDTMQPARFFAKIGVNLFGFCYEIVAKLDKVEETIIEDLTCGIRMLFSASLDWIPGEFRLWLNDLSGDLLFAKEYSYCNQVQTIPVGDNYFSDLYRLLFDAQGRRREACRYLSLEGDYLSFPARREEVARLAALLVEEASPQDPRITGHCTAMLELENLLVSHYMKI